MKKLFAVVGFLMISALFLSKDSKADGNYTPALVTSTTTGQGFLYPVSVPTAAGSVLVGNGSVFGWSNAVISATTSITTQSFPARPQATLAQLQALAPATTGQDVYCSDCNYKEAFSTGTGVGAWVVQLSSALIVIK